MVFVLPEALGWPEPQSPARPRGCPPTLPLPPAPRSVPAALSAALGPAGTVSRWLPFSTQFRVTPETGSPLC